MSRSANKYRTSEKRKRAANEEIPHGLRRSVDLACDVFLMRRGLKGQGSWGGRR